MQSNGSLCFQSRSLIIANKISGLVVCMSQPLDDIRLPTYLPRLYRIPATEVTVQQIHL